MSRSYRILLCDDSATLRSRCREMLTLAPELEVAGEADGGHAGVQLALSLGPDLVVMDVDMPDLNGVDATRRILAERPEIKVLGYSAGASWQVVREMLWAGASGYLVKGGDPDDLICAIRTVLAGGRFLGGKIQGPPEVGLSQLGDLPGGDGKELRFPKSDGTANPL
jgi:DNA-binding NarL/FixJ family response regulator